MNLSEELQWRGFVNQTTFASPSELDKEKKTFYWGVDPSASSMTIGNLAAAMMVRNFIRAGHEAILLIGGATGMIGDPDGISEERNLKTSGEIAHNKKALVNQYKRIFLGLDFKVVDNFDWFKDQGYLDFLRDVGKHVPMRQMLGRDFVQSRLGEGGAGISYAEFSYVLIQAYDFLYLSQKFGVSLQVCGSDQWGNSVAGVDLTRRLSGKEVHVWSSPLILNKSGQKFGKSEEGAVWLDENRTSVFKFYQFWLNVEDDEVESYLKIFTELDKATIENLMREFNENRGARSAQKTLAYEVTKLVHGQKRAEEIQSITSVLFGDGNFLELGKDQMHVLRHELTVVKALDDLPQTIVDGGLASSKTEARNFLNTGAIVINGQKAGPDNLHLFVKGNNLIRKGKNSFAIAEKG